MWNNYNALTGQGPYWPGKCFIHTVFFNCGRYEEN